MNSNGQKGRVSAFTFGSEQFLENFNKHPRVSKLSPFYKLQKPCSEQQSRHSRQTSQQIMTITSGENKENQFVSLNINQRIQTEANQNIIHKPPLNRFRLPRKLSNYSRPQSKEEENRYKCIAEQLKQMFILQKQFHENGSHAQLAKLYQQFETLCKQM